MSSLQKNVMKAFMKAGLSENQARIMTAEVGRENSFDPSVVFGVHPDDKNKKQTLACCLGRMVVKCHCLQDLNQRVCM